jgi:hypothetical protein
MALCKNHPRARIFWMVLLVNDDASLFGLRAGPLIRDRGHVNPVAKLRTR